MYDIAAACCLTKTMEMSDYEWLIRYRELAEASLLEFRKNNVRIDIGHPHRLWEYSMALRAYDMWAEHNQDPVTILDVGAGVGLLGPLFSLKLKLKVEEVEPEYNNYDFRVSCNSYLRSRQAPEIKWYHSSLEKMPLKKWNAIFCISVLEHTSNDMKFLEDLAMRVLPGGLLFLTTDVVPSLGRVYTFDNLRETNYTVEMLQEKISFLTRECGMDILGDSNLIYQETNVHDYNFAAITMEKL